MEVHFAPEIEEKLNDFASRSGVRADELVRDVVAGRLDGLGGVRRMLDSRYDDMKSGAAEGIDGEAFFEELRLREQGMLSGQLS